METPNPRPMIQTESSSRQPVRVGAVIRDVIIVVVLAAVGGFIVGVVTANMLAAALSNFIFGTTGFIISGCLARGNRWPHLAWVGLGVWLAVLINVFAFGFGIKQWLLSIFGVAIMMVLGGGLSYFFRTNSE